MASKAIKAPNFLQRLRRRIASVTRNYRIRFSHLFLKRRNIQEFNKKAWH